MMINVGSLIGTPSKVTIADANGRVIIKEGEIITQQVIVDAQDIGRLDELMASAPAEINHEIEPAPKYIEIGEENPVGVHPESR